MVLLRRRNWASTFLLTCATLLVYAICVFWARPGFMERQYYAKQRLWAQFLASCDCDGQTCAESFDLTMMHGSLYERLMVASEHGKRPVRQHLVWQPYKVAAAYPWRLRMYAHMGLVLPRSLALLHVYWLTASEELALAMQHLSQGVPLVLDPKSAASLHVEPDAVIECTLEATKEEQRGSNSSGGGGGGSNSSSSGGGGGGSNSSRSSSGGGSNSSSSGSSGGGSNSSSSNGDGSGGSTSGSGDVASAAEVGADAEGDDASSAEVLHTADQATGGGDGSGGGEATEDPGALTAGSQPAGGGGGGKRGRGIDSDDEADLRRFICVIKEARGATPLLRLALPPSPPPVAQGAGSGSKVPEPQPPETQPAQPAQPAQQDGQSTEPRAGGDDAGFCDAVADAGAASGSCTATAEGAAASAAAELTEADARPGTSAGGSTGGEGPVDAEGNTAAVGAPGTNSAMDGSSSSNGGGGGGGPGGDAGNGSGGRRRRGGGGGGRFSKEDVCRNVIFIRPPRKSEVSEHIRDSEASPLGLGPLELLRLVLPRVSELAGWLVLPHVMIGRYVLLLSPPAPATTSEQRSDGGGKSSGGMFSEQLPLLPVGSLLMLIAGVVLTTFELLLWLRVTSELLSRRRPGRSWARRRMAVWRLVYEGIVQPLREALLSWNVTHFVALPLLQLGLSAPTVDVALLLPLAYCVGLLGAANSDVAARATPALLRIVRRVRQHEGGYHLLLLSVVEAAEPLALPYIIRLMLPIDLVGNAGRAAVLAAMLAEAPGVAAALAAARQRERDAAAAAAGNGGGGGGGEDELAAAMQALVAADVGGRARNARGGADEQYDSDEDEEDEDEEVRRDGRTVMLRWPAPLQLAPEVHDWEDVPRGFTCAITQQLMTQPAMLVSPELAAAPTYERAAIQQWLAAQMRDPKSNTPLRSYSLLPNEDLHRAIDDWVGQRLRAAKAAADPKRTRRRRAERRDPPAANQAAEDGTAPAPGSAPTPLGHDAAAAGSADVSGAASSLYSGDSEPCAESGSRSGGGTARSTSVLASLAQGASNLVDTGVEVVSWAAAAVAATAAGAGGSGRRGLRLNGSESAAEPVAEEEGDEGGD